MISVAAGDKRVVRADVGVTVLGARRRSLGRRATAALVLGVVAVAFVLRLLTAQGDFVTTDEANWLNRSNMFYEGVTSGDFAAASATTPSMSRDPDATMPGVTTMWVGSVAHAFWSLGDDGTEFPEDAAALDLAQVIMALATSLALGVLVLLVCLWAGRPAAAVAGVLLATEPFFVAHSAVLHTDMLTTLFGAAALVATALALGVPKAHRWTGRPGAGALAGALWGLSLLTKLSALVFLPGAVLLGLWALAAAVRRACRKAAGSSVDWPEAGDHALRAAVAPLLRVTGWWVTAAAVTVFALYPALWVAPLQEADDLRRSMTMAGGLHTQFFLGRVTGHPGPAFYGVALPLRMTPWFLAGALVAVVAIWRRPTRPLGLALACMGAPALVVLSLASKQFDRYGLPMLVTCALAVGVVAAPLVATLRRRWPGAPGRRVAAAGGGALAAALAAYSLSVAPWGLAYYNPALGGGGTAVDTVLVGWWEGLEQVGQVIAERERGHCDDVNIEGPGTSLVYPCGRVRGRGEADYVVLYVSAWQRWPAESQELAADRPLLATVRERGITYVELYGPRRADDTDDR